MPTSNRCTRITVAGSRFLDSVDEIGDGITIQILSVFPNFVLQQIHNSIAFAPRIAEGPDKTELQWTYIGFEDDDAMMTERRLQQANLVGPAGYVSMRTARSAALSSARSRAARATRRHPRWAGTSIHRRRRGATEASVRRLLAGVAAQYGV